LNNILSFQMWIDVSFIISVLVFRLLPRYVLECIEKDYNIYINILQVNKFNGYNLQVTRGHDTHVTHY